MDLVYSKCVKFECQLEILFITANEDDASSLCGSEKQITVDYSNKQTFEVKDLNEAGYKTVKSRDPTGANVAIIAADFDQDGYNDLSLIVQNEESFNAIVFLRNAECLACSRKRTLKSWQSINSNDLIRILPFDLNEDGMIDLLAVGRQTAMTVVNRLRNDAFFLSLLVTSGACGRQCSTTSSSSSYRPIGAVVPGATIKCTIFDTAGHRRTLTASQLSNQFSAGHRPLPVTLLGLGRTNNYIEELLVRVSPIREAKSWSGLVPNSQLIIGLLLNNDNEWYLEMFVSPSKYIKYVLISLITGVLLLGAVVAALKYAESRQDEAERRRYRHSIL